MDYSQAIITEHALEQIAWRGISSDQINSVLANPEAVLPVREGRVVVQGMSGEYLLRIIVDDDRQPPEVVTVYRTSNIKKYRKNS